MPICPEFEAMTPIERSTYIGSLVHICQNNSDMFKHGEELIQLGILIGLFDKVKINPEPQDNSNTDITTP